MKDDSPLVFAGLWEGWKDPANDRWLHACTIITGERMTLCGRSIPECRSSSRKSITNHSCLVVEVVSECDTGEPVLPPRWFFYTVRTSLNSESEPPHKAIWASGDNHTFGRQVLAHIDQVVLARNLESIVERPGYHAGRVRGRPQCRA